MEFRQPKQIIGAYAEGELGTGEERQVFFSVLQKLIHNICPGIGGIDGGDQNIRIIIFSVPVQQMDDSAFLCRETAFKGYLPGKLRSFLLYGGQGFFEL